MSLPLSYSTLKEYASRLHLWNMLDTVKDTLADNPYSKDERVKHVMWLEQCLVNFPLLYWASIHLNRFAQKKGCNTFLFATRDCCHWYKLFSKMFPGYSVHYFDSSRNMLESATQTENKFFNQYVGKLVDQGKKIDQTIYIDIHGTGKRMVEYFDKHWSNVPFCFLLTAAESSYLTMPKETRRLKDKGRLKVMSYDVRGGPIEMLNYDLIGTCQTYNEKGAVRDKLEYDKELVSVYHECMENLIKTVEPFVDTALSKRLFTESEKKKKYWRYMKRVLREYTDIIQRQKPIVSKKVRHVGVHPRKFRNRKRK